MTAGPEPAHGRHLNPLMERVGPGVQTCQSACLRGRNRWALIVPSIFRCAEIRRFMERKHRPDALTAGLPISGVTFWPLHTAVRLMCRTGEGVQA